MATKRIKDISTTATTFAADDYIALDASSVGTRKMAKASLITQVGANYLEKADNLSDVASKDTSKLNLEVPNVGTAANEVPVNGMLGDLAFQSSAAVTVDDLTVDGELIAAVGKPMPVNGPTMRFDGVDDVVEFAVGNTSSAFTFNNGTDDLPYTVSGWIKVSADATYFNVISKWSGNTPTSEWLFRVDNNNKLQLRMRGGAPYFDATSNNSLSNYEDQWVHVAASYAGAGPNSATSFAKAASAITLYVNGKSIASTDYISDTAYSGMVGSAQNVAIGKASSTWALGEIRDVKLYNKELSAAEVREVYSNGQLPESFAESTGTSNLVTNGDFSSGSGWVTDSDWTVGSGVATTTGAASNYLYQTGSATSGKRHRLSFDFTRTSGSGNIIASYYDTAYRTIVIDSTNASGKATGEFIAPSNGNIYFRSTSGWAGSIDNVSLTQIGSVLDARAEQFDTSTGKLYDLSGNDFVGTQSGGVSLLGREFPVYETGNWVPALEFGNASVGISYGDTEGFFTRIGNQVTVRGIVTLTSKGTSTGYVRLLGLPYAGRDMIKSYDGFVVNQASGMASLTSGLTMTAVENTTEATIQQFGSSGSSAIQDTSFTNSSSLRFSGTYQIQ